MLTVHVVSSKNLPTVVPAFREGQGADPSACGVFPAGHSVPPALPRPSPH